MMLEHVAESESFSFTKIISKIQRGIYTSLLMFLRTANFFPSLTKNAKGNSRLLVVLIDAV